MKSLIDLAIVIPVGPGCHTAYILDTIDSVKQYVRCSYHIIISDDSQNPVVCASIGKQHPDVIILRTTKNHGKGLGLYVTLSNAFCYALDNFDFSALLRLDTDALVIGPEPEAKILDFFKTHPSIGLAGRYVKGLTSHDQFGNIWQNGGRKPLVAIAKLFTKYFFRHPIINWRIRNVMFSAINQGYDLGEFVFGGAYAFSRLGLEKLRDNNLLPITKVLGADMEEDHFFSMLMVSVGMGLGDLASGNNPFACTWKGLPAHPETILEADKKIIHSTRYWQEVKEDEIRRFFKDKRENAYRRLDVYSENDLSTI